MRTIKRKHLRRKVLAIKTAFFTVVGVKRTDGKKFRYTFRLVSQDKKFLGKKIILAKKIVRQGKAQYRLIALEGVKRVKIKGRSYKVVE